MALAANPRQIDPNTIPPAVRRQAEAAERLRAQAAGEVPADGEQPPAPAPGAPEPPPQSDQQQTPVLEQKTEAPQPPPAQPEPKREEPGPDDWKHRYESERGRTEAARKQVAQLSEEVGNLQRLMAQMQSAPSTPAQRDPQLTFNDENTRITPEEMEQWGPELMAIIEKKARQIAGPLQQQLQDELAKVQTQLQGVGNTVVIDARERMKQALNSNPNVGDWVALNDDQDFVNWLKMPDPLSGQIRHDMLLAAWNSNNASRVAAFFEGFLREAGRASAPQASNGKANGSQQPAASKPSLEQFAAPGRARASAPAQPAANQDIITTGDVSAHFTAVQTGRYKGHEDKKLAFEKAMHQASAVGAIAQGGPTRTFP